MTPFASLLDPILRDRSLSPVRDWGHRIGLQARDALESASLLGRLLEPRDRRIASISRFYGLNGPSHAFHVEPLRWMRLTETQATRGLAHFIEQGGAPRALAFLKAIDGEVPWPGILSDTRASAEVAADTGRIDLLVTGRADGRTWGAIVEAKFDHDLKSNPLAAYARYASSIGLTPRTGPSDVRATGTLIVLAPRRSRTTTSRLTRNRRWRLVHWSSLLRRLEHQLAGQPDDDDFRRFRRTLWDRIS